MAIRNKNISKRADAWTLYDINKVRVDTDRLYISKKFQSISYEGVKELLKHLNERLNVNSSVVYLLLEKDECVAHCGKDSVTFSLNRKEKYYLLTDRGSVWEGGMVLPLTLNDLVIGYVQVVGEILEEDEEYLLEIGDLYADLIVKEMELEYNRSKVEYYSHNLIHEKRESKKQAHHHSIVMDMAVHDLSSPLSAIHGYLEMIEKNLKKNQNLETIKKYYERISIGVQDITAILTQFEDLKNIKTRSDDLNLVLTNLNWMISDIAKLYKLKAEKQNLELTSQLPEEPVYVMADVTRMKRSIINLVGNAIKYSKPKGFVKIQLEADEAHAILHVIDNGIGVSEDKKNDIFKPFFQISKDTSKKDPSSVGLGLFIATNFVKQMDGHIDMKSREGKGSRFSIYLPRIRKDEF